MEKRLRGDRTGQISPTALRSDRRRGWCSQTHADTTEPCAAAWARAAEGSRQFDPTQRCGMREAGSRNERPARSSARSVMHVSPLGVRTEHAAATSQPAGRQHEAGRPRGTSFLDV